MAIQPGRRGWGLRLSLVTVAAHSPAWRTRAVQKACPLLPHPPLWPKTVTMRVQSCSEA